MLFPKILIKTRVGIKLKIHVMNTIEKLKLSEFVDISDKMDKIQGGLIPGNTGCTKNKKCKNKGCTTPKNEFESIGSPVYSGYDAITFSGY